MQEKRQVSPKQLLDALKSRITVFLKKCFNRKNDWCVALDYTSDVPKTFRYCHQYAFTRVACVCMLLCMYVSAGEVSLPLFLKLGDKITRLTNTSR